MMTKQRKGDIPTIRRAGVLMHITSLPGQFGIGDFGPEAYRFADFLQQCGQTYWQILPLNPTDTSSGESPYSSISTFAGNTLLISPEKLAEDGLLDSRELYALKVPPTTMVNFEAARKVRGALLDKAYLNFIGRGGAALEDFKKYCIQENYWLDDFSAFVVLKELNNGKPWYDWPKPYRNRTEKQLRILISDKREPIEKVKWLQYVFAKQWNDLKGYCNDREIQLFGDLPFYVSYDSADVWAHRDIFMLDKTGRMKAVAGVPPDYFNENGQLWGMPVFRWNVLRAKNYSWWVDRIAKNLEQFDVLRLDHFRAFSAYWSVPSAEKTARRGTWQPGPGHDLFHQLSKQLKSLPLVAEDLGDIDEKVRTLRNDFSMPGMKVLQFAFGDHAPTSEYIPHNYESNFVVYTGTHDNNTTKGWYRRDAGKTERKNLNEYLQGPISVSNIATLFIRLAYASVAKIAIIPMQDLLNLDERSRMNAPATTHGNWRWRMAPRSIDRRLERWLRKQVNVFNRLEK